MEKVTMITPVASVRFPNLTSTEVIGGVDTGKYAITLMFKPEDVKPLEEAIRSAGGGKGKSPLKEMTGEYDTGMFAIKAKTTNIDWVKAIDTSNKDVPLGNVSHGDEARAKVTFAHYEMQGGGVTTYLGGIQVLKSGGSDMDFGDLPEGYEPRSDEELDDELPF